MLTLVIVEDHGIASAGLQLLLGDHTRFKLLGIIQDGARAEAEIARLDPDLVLLDIALPGKSGLDILESLKAVGARQKILILSGQANAMDFKRAIDLGADGVMSKSEPPELIAQALVSIAQGVRHVSEVVRAIVEPVGDSAGVSLTARERQVLAQMAGGLSNGEIAEKIGVASPTVKKHRENLMRKLKVSTAVEASRVAYQLGLVIMPPKA